jgi:hypothetical protein
MTKETLKAYLERDWIVWRRTDIGVIINPLFSELQGFIDIVGSWAYGEEKNCVLRNGYACIEIEPILQYWDINPNDVFIGDESSYVKDAKQCNKCYAIYSNDKCPKCHD